MLKKAKKKCRGEGLLARSEAQLQGRGKKNRNVSYNTRDLRKRDKKKMGQAGSGSCKQIRGTVISGRSQNYSRQRKRQLAKMLSAST